MLAFQYILVFWYFGKAPWVRSNSAMVAEPIYSLILADSVSAQLPFLLQVPRNLLPPIGSNKSTIYYILYKI